MTRFLAGFVSAFMACTVAVWVLGRRRMVENEWRAACDRFDPVTFLAQLDAWQQHPSNRRPS